MNPRRSFIRKICYFSAIGVLLIPLYLLNIPATVNEHGKPVEGGKLARVRHELNLNQADLGEIDPTSATMKLSMLGLDAFASNLLWSKALDAKDREDWTTFEAALQQITNLQPHFAEVWKFQAHNVSFNISVEFDDWRDRYRYVIKGIKLLERGARFNDKNPRILRDLAFFTGFKIGKSDEAKLYRKTFREDDDFHKIDRMEGTHYAGRPEVIRDNWLVSKWWYSWVDRLIDHEKVAYTSLSPVMVHLDAPRAQISYAQALEDDGDFDKAAEKDAEGKTPWSKARDEWDQYGLRQMTTMEGVYFQLDKLAEQEQQTRSLQVRLDQLLNQEPEVRDRMLKQRRDALTEKERAAMAKPLAERSDEERPLAFAAEAKLKISPREQALALSPTRRADAVRLADQLQLSLTHQGLIASRREQVNFEYWKVRCEVEQMPQTVAARKAIHEGNVAYSKAKLPEALQKYEEGISGWKKVIEAYPKLMDEKSLVTDLRKMIEKYRLILRQHNRNLPDKDFALENVMQKYEELVKRKEIQPISPGDVP